MDLFRFASEWSVVGGWRVPWGRDNGTGEGKTIRQKKEKSGIGLGHCLRVLYRPLIDGFAIKKHSVPFAISLETLKMYNPWFLNTLSLSHPPPHPSNPSFLPPHFLIPPTPPQDDQASKAGSHFNRFHLRACETVACRNKKRKSERERARRAREIKNVGRVKYEGIEEDPPSRHTQGRHSLCFSLTQFFTAYVIKKHGRGSYLCIYVNLETCKPLALRARSFWGRRFLIIYFTGSVSIINDGDDSE